MTATIAANTEMEMNLRITRPSVCGELRALAYICMIAEAGLPVKFYSGDSGANGGR